MAEHVYCGQCGSQLGATDRFCSACGAQQPEQEAAKQKPGGEDRLRTERIEQITPGAAELAGALAAQARRPGVARPGISALIGAGAMLGVGLLVALLFPGQSAIAFIGLSLLEEMLDQACAFTLAQFQVPGLDSSLRFTPAIFVAVPLLGTGVPAYLLAKRADKATGARAMVGWGAATGLPFALLMLIVALIVGETEDANGFIFEPSLSGVFFLSLLWGSIGGGAGAALACDRERLRGLLPDRVRAFLQLAWTPLRALLLSLAVTAALGTAAVLVQTIRDAGHIRETDEGTRSVLLASIDSALYAVEHGVHFNELGAGVKFKAPALSAAGGVPLPVARFEELTGGQDEFDDLDELLEADTGTFNIFDYRKALPVWAFIPLLGLIAIPALFALYGGFSLARTAGARSLGLGAAWGALVGPVWSLAMIVINALINKVVLNTGLFGAADGDSVFTMYLLGGAVLGALGGLLAAQGAAAEARGQAEGAAA